MNFKHKILPLSLVVTMFISLTGFNTKETSIDQNLLKDDFYTAINKDWLSEAKIKNINKSTSTISETEDKIIEKKKAILDELISKRSSLDKNSTERKLVDFYSSLTDTKGRNDAGIKPIEKYLEQIKSVKSTDELTKLLGDSTFSLFNQLISFSIFSYMKENQKESKNVIYIGSSRLSLGNSDEYTSPSKDSEKSKIANLKYIKSLFTLSGYTMEEADKKVQNINEFEEMLAPSMISYKALLEEMESNPTSNIYDPAENTYTIKDIENMTPNINLKSIFSSLGYNKANTVILSDLKWLKKLDELYTNENLPLIKDYVELSVIDYSSTFLSDDFHKITTDLHTDLGFPGDTVSSEDNSLMIIDILFGDAIANIYQQKYFSIKDKTEIEVIIHQVKNSYKKMLTNTTVIGTETKNKAIEKLDKMKVKVGFPDKWKDYSDLKISSYENGGSILENFINYNILERNNSINSLGKSPNNILDFLPPLLVNAFHNYDQNTIIFPAGILQPPFFNPDKTREENLGSLGIIIAHEISHGFDTTGSQFDADGKINNWWSKDDATNFQKRAEKVKAFYSKIEYIPGLYVNGESTLNENIADVAAVTCVLDVLNDMSNVNYKNFFESWPKSFRIYQSNEDVIEGLQYDSHSPNKVRINAAFQQFDKFYETYGIKKGNKMYVEPKDRLKIW